MRSFVSGQCDKVKNTRNGLKYEILEMFQISLAFVLTLAASATALGFGLLNTGYGGGYGQGLGGYGECKSA